jgi:ATP-dependent helicase HrpB
MLNLPIDRHIPEICAKIHKAKNLILTASPGSGKTTRLPPALTKTLKKNERIIVLVPKRIAAVSAAYRIADENKWKVGKEIGYQVRFDSNFCDETALLFMTEGVFVKRCSDESFWKNLKYIVLDEFHERSSFIDIALGVCNERQILGAEFKTIVMSATLNVKKIADFMIETEIVSAEERPFKLVIVKSNKPQRLICDELFADNLWSALNEGLKKSHRDVLIFLPGLREINFIERFLKRKNIQLPITVLHGNINLEDQVRILQPFEHRRIILSTNVAESSVTIPSVDLVIDSGLVKKSVQEEKVGFQRLELTRISQFSAIQRAGRAARTGDGHCYQLWHELDERSMPEQIEPEILQSNLLEESLIVLNLGIKNPDQFSWLDKPKKSFQDILEKFLKWGIINNDFSLTPKGKLVQNCPLDPEKSLLFIELAHGGHLESASLLAAFIESANFDLLSEMPDLLSLPLNENGKRIRNQLLSMKSLDVSTKPQKSYKLNLAEIFLRNFPEKIAILKDKKSAISSLGRGIEPAQYLTAKDYKYLLMLAGREISSALTRCDFAIPFSEPEFQPLLESFQTTKSYFGIDFEKLKIYKTEMKYAGPFKISESPRKYNFDSHDRDEIRKVLNDHFFKLLEFNEEYSLLKERINFLMRKKEVLQLSEFNLDNLDKFLHDSFLNMLLDADSFRSADFVGAAHTFLPEELVKILSTTPLHLKLPNGKRLRIDYVSEQAPRVSARVQDFYGIDKHPFICDGRIALAIEMLAPNNRPTQITGQLDRFWTEGYFELRKELKARYPKHSWPDRPQDKASIIVPLKIKPS